MSKRWLWLLVPLPLLAGGLGWLAATIWSASSKEVSWADALLSVSTALALFAFVAAAVFAGVEVADAREKQKASRTEESVRWAMEIGRQWDEDLAPVRRQIAADASTGEELRQCLETLWRLNSPQFFQFLREPAYWDRVAYLIDNKVLVSNAVGFLAGPNVAFRWNLWQPAVVDFLRQKLGFCNAYEGFERLAKTLGQEHLLEYSATLVPSNAKYLGPR